MAYDWTFQGRSEMVRCSLDTLAICSIMPKVQLSFCEKIKLYDETNVGVHILLSAAEGEIVQVSSYQYCCLCHINAYYSLVRGLRVCSLGGRAAISICLVDQKELST